MVITLNTIEAFPYEMPETLTSIEKVSVENETSDAVTKIYCNDEIVREFKKFTVMHHQKVNIQGTIWNRDFNHVLRRFGMKVYAKENFKHIITISSSKGEFAHKAFKRLYKTTPVKCIPVDINLIDALPLLVTNTTGITITSGWFSQVGLPNLNNVLLQGVDVNQCEDWIRFKGTSGAKLSNIELLIEDGDFERGNAKISLSARGFLFSKTSMRDEKCIEIAEKIIDLIRPCLE